MAIENGRARKTQRRLHHFRLREHSLSVATGGITATWLLLYWGAILRRTSARSTASGG